MTNKKSCPSAGGPCKCQHCQTSSTPAIGMAIAHIQGGPLAPQIKGTVIFHAIPGGAEVSVDICGLPAFQAGCKGQPQIGPHGFHIHDKCSCKVGDPANPFMDAGSHWNPTNQPHGNHAGDFPNLFSNHGCARMTFCTDRFTLAAIINKTIVIHESPDDYHTQPSGNSGRRLACGVIHPATHTSCQR